MGGVEGKLATSPLVVIVGGGYGGVGVAQALDKEGYNVLVLEARDAFYHSIGAMRAAADKEFAPNILMPYNNVLKHGLIAKANVTKVTTKGVHVEGVDEPIPFDYLVLATGARYPVEAFRPASDKFENMLDECSATYAQIEKADNIAVVGSGPVGCEFSGEILRTFPKKNVTLVSRSEHVLHSKYFKDFLGIEWEKQVDKVVDKEHFKILAGHSVNPDEQKEDGFVITDKNEKVKADAVFYAIGNKARASEGAGIYEPIKDHFDDASKRLKVTSSLRLEGESNIFVIGDLAQVDEPSTSIIAAAHAEYVSKTIQLLAKGKTDVPEYKAGPEMIFVPFGEIAGAAAMMGKYPGSFGNFMVKMAKGKDVLAGQFWGNLNADIKKKPEKYEIGDLSSDKFKTILKRYNDRHAEAVASAE